jgi:histidinol-phosphatase (PHP family)
MLTDYHLHSNFSVDGVQTLDALCESAIARGLDEIAVTEHMDIFSDKPYGYILDCENAFAALRAAKEKYADRLIVRIGTELGQPMANPTEAARFLRDWPLDFIIGSVHNLENDVDVYYYDYTKVDYQQMLPHYLDVVLDFALHYEYDVLGHLSYPVRYIEAQTGVRPDLLTWEDRVRAILQAAIDRGRGIELNLSALARGQGEIMPALPVLKLYHQMGGEIITLGSDAHVAEQVGTVAKVGQEILREAGFSAFTTYEKHKPTQNPLIV